MINTVFLDLDGPVLNVKHRHYRCYADILEQHGYEPINIERYWMMKRWKHSIIELLAISDAENIYDIFIKSWQANIERMKYLKLDRIQDGVVDYLRAWHIHGIRIVLVTMRINRKNLIKQLSHAGLEPFLNAVIVTGHADGANGKAHHVRCSIPSIDQSRCLWIGDTELDYEAAVLIGCPVCLLSCGLRNEGFLTSLQPDFMKYQLTELKLEEILDGT